MNEDKCLKCSEKDNCTRYREIKRDEVLSRIEMKGGLK